MANKGKVVKEEIKDDYQFDDDLDMENFDLEFSEPKDDRSPLTAASSGALQGAMDGLFDGQFISDKIKDTIHPGYGKTLDMASYLDEKVNKTYVDSIKAAKPAVDQFKRTMLEVVPKDAQYVPDFLKEKLAEWQGDLRKPSADQDIAQARESMLNVQLGSIFNAQFEQTDQIRQEDNYKAAVKDNIELSRYKQTVGFANEQTRALSRIDQYLRNVNLEWQKKDLELNYRQFFVLQDLLTTAKNVGQVTIDNLPAITKNTALPDFVKQTNKEFLAEYQKTRFIDAIGSGLFGSASEYLEKGLNNLSKNVVKGIGNFAKSAQDGISQIGGVFSAGDTMGERTESMGGRILGGMAGSGLLEYGSEYAEKNGWLDKLKQNETVGKYGRKLSRGVRNAGTLAADTQREWAKEVDDGSLVSKIKGLLTRSFGAPNARQDIGVKNSNQLLAPHDITFRTINEIMPGYMSRMLNELVLIRKGQKEEGDAKGDRLVYDHDKNDFVSRGALKSTLSDKVASKQDIQAFDDKLNKFLDTMGAKQLPPPVQKSLRNALVKAKIDNTTPTQANLTNKKYFQGEGAKQAREFLDKYTQDFSFDEDKRDQFEIGYQNLLDGMKNIRGDISRSIGLSQTSELKELGVIDKDNLYDGNGVADLYLSKIQEPVQVEKKKKGGKAKPSESPASPDNIPPVELPPMPFAKGGVLKGISDLSGKVTSSPQKFMFADDGKIKEGVLGEAGTEAILPAQGGVQAVDAQGNKAGKLQLSRDTGGKLSVELPSGQTKPSTQSNQETNGKLQAYLLDKHADVEKLEKDFARKGKVDRNLVISSLEKNLKVVGVKDLSFLGLDTATDAQLVELYKNVYLTMHTRQFYKQLGDNVSVKAIADKVHRGLNTALNQPGQSTVEAFSQQIAQPNENQDIPAQKPGLYAKLSSSIKDTFRGFDSSGAKKIFNQAKSGDFSGAVSELVKSTSGAYQDSTQAIKALPESKVYKTIKDKSEKLLQEYVPDYQTKIAQAQQEINQAISDPRVAYGKAKDSAVQTRDKTIASVKKSLLDFVGEEDAQALSDDYQAGKAYLQQSGQKALGYVKSKTQPYAEKITSTDAYHQVKDQMGEAASAVSGQYNQAKKTLSDKGEKISAMDWGGSEKASSESQGILSQMDDAQLGKEVFRQNYIGRVGELTKHYSHVLTPRESKKFVEFGQQKLSDYIAKNGEPQTPGDIEKFEKEVFGDYKNYLENVEDSYQGLKGFGKKLWDKISNFFSALGGNLSTLFGDALGGAENFLNDTILKIKGKSALEFKQQLQEISQKYGPYTPAEEKAFTEFNEAQAQEYFKKFGKPKTDEEQEAMFEHALQASEGFLSNLRGQKPREVNLKTKDNVNKGNKITPSTADQGDQKANEKSWAQAIKDKYQQYNNEKNSPDNTQSSSLLSSLKDSALDKFKAHPVGGALSTALPFVEKMFAKSKQLLGEKAEPIFTEPLSPSQAVQKVSPPSLTSQFAAPQTVNAGGKITLGNQTGQYAQSVAASPQATLSSLYYQDGKVSINDKVLVSKANAIIERYTPQLTGEDPAKFGLFVQKTLSEEANKNGQADTPEKSKKAQEVVLNKISNYLEALRKKKPGGGKIRKLMEKAGTTATEWSKIASGKANELVNAIPIPAMMPDDESAVKTQTAQENAKETLRAHLLRESEQIQTEPLFKKFTANAMARVSSLGEKAIALVGASKQKEGGGQLGENSEKISSTGQERSIKNKLFDSNEPSSFGERDTLIDIRDTLYAIEDILSNGAKGKSGSKWYNPFSWGKGNQEEEGGQEDDKQKPTRNRKNIGSRARLFGGGIAGMVGGLASGATNMIGSGIKNTAKATAWVAGKNLDAVSWAGKKVTNFATSPEDVYVEGENKPRLYGVLFGKGVYFKLNKKTQPKNHRDIDDVIVNEKGQILIRQEELNKLYNKGLAGRMTRLGKGLFKAGLWGAEKVMGGMLDTARLVPWMAKKTWQTATGSLKVVKNAYDFFGDGPDDVYTPGVKDPVMVKTVMKTGGYLSKFSGKPVMKPTDIDGPVIDLDGKEVLTLDQFRKGIFNVHGDKFKTTTGKLVSGFVNVGSGILKAQQMAWKASKGIAKGLFKGVTGLAKWGLSGFSLEINGAKSRVVLEEIRDMLKAKFALDNPLFGDKDGDGDRDNSSKDQLENNKKKDQEKKQTGQDKGGKKSLKEKIQDKGDKAKEGITDVLGKLGSAVSGLIDGVKGLKSIGSLFGGLLSKGGLLARGAGAIGGLLGLSGGASAAGVAGAVGAAEAVGVAGGAAAASAAASTAAGAGVVGAGGVAAAAGGVAALPVALAALGIAAVGYGGYKLYKWATTTSLTTLDNYRLVQYGFQYGDEDNFQKIAELESVVLKNTSDDGKINEEKISLEEIGNIFGVGTGFFKFKSTKNEELKTLLSWYQYRFKPVFFASLRAAGGVNGAKGASAFKAIAQFKGNEAGIYLDNAGVDSGVLSTGMPIGRMKPTGENDVNSAEAKIRAEMKLPSRGMSKRKGGGKAQVATPNATDKPNDARAVSKNGETTPPASADKGDNAVQQGSRIVKDNDSFKAYQQEQSDKSPTSIWDYAKKAGMVGLGVAVMGLPATALIGGGYLAYKYGGSAIEGVKDWLDRPTLDGLHLLRMTQYGFYRQDTENHKRAAKLESVLFGYVKKNGTGFDIDDKKLRMEYVQKIFEIDLNDQTALNAFFNWYQNRFKPVFITNLSVAQIITNQKDYAQAFKDLNGLKPEEKLTFLQKAAWPEGPYSVPCPVTSKNYPHQGAAQVNDMLAWLKKDLKLGQVKAKVITDKQGNLVQFDTKYNAPETTLSKNLDVSKIGSQGQTVIKSGELASTGEKVLSVQSLIDKKLVAGDGDIDYMDEATYSELIDLASLKQEGALTAIEAVYYKAMGLTELEQSKIRSIQAIEKIVASKTTYADGKATWTGSMLEVLNNTKGQFGILDPQGKEGKLWAEWFTKRFLPVYLKFLSLYCAYTGSKEYGGNISALKVSQQLDIAKQIAAMDVWRYIATPWPDYLVSTDAKSTKNNIAFLEETVKKEIATEEKAQEKKRQGVEASGEENKGLKAALFGNKELSKQLDSLGKQNQQASNQSASPDSEKAQNGTPTATASPAGGKMSANPGELKMASGERLDGGNWQNAVGLANNDIKIDGINPAMKTLFFGMADEYKQLTGQKLIVTDGYRSYEDQVRMKQKYGARAATPGESMHGGSGIAIDADSKALDKAESLGLMRKYGLTRPVGGEPWHVEPIGTQFDLPNYKLNSSLATNVIMEGVGRGGGGYGTVSGAAAYKRNIDLSKSIYSAKVEPNVKLEGISKDKAAPGGQAAISQPQATPSTQGGGTTGQAPNAKPTTGGKAITPSAPKGDTLNVASIGGGYMGSGKVIDSGGDLTPKVSTGVALSNQGQTVNAGNTANADGGVTKAPLESERKIAQVSKPKDNSVESIKKTVEEAAKTVGINPDLAKTTVAIESGFNPNAKAKGSSASGLNQFISSTWDSVVSRYGKPYGYYPGSVSPFDPQANAIMGAHFLKENEQALRRKGDNDVDSVDLYAAHFLGAGGANTLNEAIKQNPNQDSTKVMPEAASANRGIFYDLQRPKNVAEVRRTLEGKVKSKAEQFGITPPIGKSVTGNSPSNDQSNGQAPQTTASGASSKQTTTSYTTPAEQAQPVTQMVNAVGRFGDRDSFMARIKANTEQTRGETNTDQPTQSDNPIEQPRYDTPSFLKPNEIKKDSPDVGGFDFNQAFSQNIKLERQTRQDNSLFAQALKPTEGILRQHLDITRKIHETLINIDRGVQRFADRPQLPAPVEKNGKEKTGKELIEQTQSQPEFTGRRPAFSGMSKWEIPTSRNV